MAERLVEERVARLEELMAETWRAIERTDYQLERTDRQIDRTTRELDRLSQEMREFKAEMRAFKAEMREFKAEMQADRKEMNKKWGELANKWGTLAEDIVAPSVPRILRQVTGCPQDQMKRIAVRVRCTHPAEPGRLQEYDVVAVCGEYVLIAEAKTSLDANKITEFVALMTEARGFFPEYADPQYKFIGAIAALYVDPSVVSLGQKQGVLVLGLGEDLMQVLNEPGFAPRYF